MSQVNVTISGKTYRMACEDGQEEHLSALGRQLGDIIESLRDQFGEIGDQRLTVMAAITLADQFSETERRLKSLESELAGLQEARSALADSQDNAEAGIADTIVEVAERLETMAGRLNGAGRADGAGP